MLEFPPLLLFPSLPLLLPLLDALPEFPPLLVLPLLLDLAAFYVEDGQNRLVDEWQLDTDRAAVLSTMNIGVNLVEVVSLFASSAIVGLGIHWCFTVCGILLVLCGAVYVVRTKKE